ncbi:hypothetical protein RRG08_014563 [Elysia crispata]|uniref:SAM domain-containing protein n=1 Tax=Elysia crispata TaxID=231223 RepID=A0AAE1ATW3_9GAST|nr:hypothetical protein RRG08_014563 [Elysia crispata]
MSDNVVRREVQRRDDPFGIPACFYWTMDEVADWVDSIGYGKYKENFRSHFINGRKLLTVDACVLPRMGITHFGDILDIAGLIRNLLCTGRSFIYRSPEKFQIGRVDLPRTIQHYPGLPQTNPGPSRTAPNGLSRTILDCSGLPRTVQDYFELSQTAPDCSGLPQTASDFSGK